MHAILIDKFGGPDVLHIGTAAKPRPGPDQVLIEVAATTVNRPDTIQREGRYPPPPGESAILGLEAAGTVVETGAEVRDFAIGDRVTALLGGGGYAQFAVAYASHLIRLPGNLSFEQAACIPETYITAFQNLFLNARLLNTDRVLLHGGGGGVNTAAIQICRALTPDTEIFVTASSAKLARVAALGAHQVIDYRRQNFAEVVLERTNGRGVDVILDHIGAEYFDDNLKCLAIGGRLAIIATLGGREVTLDLARLMVKRQCLIGSVLRPRPAAEKAAIISQFTAAVMPHVASGAIVPIIDRIVPLSAAAEAHRVMQASEHFGKIVLAVGSAQ